VLRRALFVAGLTVLLVVAAFGLFIAAVRFSWDEVPPPPSAITLDAVFAPHW